MCGPGVPTMSQYGEDTRSILADLIESRRSLREYSGAPVSRAALEWIVACGQGPSGAGQRNAPSAHALYPLRLFAIINRLDDSSCPPGLYAFDGAHRRLGPRLGTTSPQALRATSLADDHWLEHAAVVLVVAADYPAARGHFADQQPDGLRGERYVHIETGAVLQNLHLATQAQGLGGVIVAGFDDRRLAGTLALPDGLRSVALFCIGAPP
ncbi:nitroreductase [Salinisphaera sp. S4-8]